MWTPRPRQKCYGTSSRKTELLGKRRGHLVARALRRQPRAALVRTVRMLSEDNWPLNPCSAQLATSLNLPCMRISSLHSMYEGRVWQGKKQESPHIPHVVGPGRRGQFQQSGRPRLDTPSVSSSTNAGGWADPGGRAPGGCHRRRGASARRWRGRRRRRRGGDRGGQLGLGCRSGGGLTRLSMLCWSTRVAEYPAHRAWHVGCDEIDCSMSFHFGPFRGNCGETRSLSGSAPGWLPSSSFVPRSSLFSSLALSAA